MVNKSKFDKWLTRYGEAMGKKHTNPDYVQQLVGVARRESSKPDSTLYPVWEYLLKSRDGKFSTNGVVRAPSKKAATQQAMEKEKKASGGRDDLVVTRLEMSSSSSDAVRRSELYLESLTEEEQLEEVLDVAARRRRAQVMRRFSKKIAMARQSKARRMASKEQLVTRSRRAAIGAIRTKFAGAMGQNYANLSPSQKIAVDQKVAKRKTLIGRIAQRMFPKVRRKEMDRLAARNRAS